MKRKAMAFVVLTATLLIFVLNMVYVGDAKADGPSYTVEWVDHQVKILYNGYILINDTIKVNGNMQNGILIGFPYKYASYVLRYIAYNTANFTQRYIVVSGVPLDNRMGFHGFKVTLNPQPENGVFSVIFVLSNSLLRQNPQNTTLYTLDFPAYPSLTADASSCNASVVLPPNAKFVSGTGTVNATNYSVKKTLPQFTYEPANLTFQLTTGDIQLFTVMEFKREINIGSTGEIMVSDSYYIKNESPQQMTSVKVAVPQNASSVWVEDEFGRKGKITLDTRTGMYTVSLSLPVESGKSTRFIVKYNLPKNMSFTFFQEINYYIEKASIIITLPEGAKITSLRYESALPIGTYGVSRDVFQEKITISKQGVLSLDSFSIKLAYECNPLWLAFRPTLWVWAIAVFGCAIVAVWKRPKAAEVVVPTVAVRLSPEILRRFVKSYEEKRRITSDIKSLEVAVSKGRIPRQRYKVQRKTLETRLAALSRSLDDLKLKLRSAGGRYADLMHQLEVAETELNEVESNIRSIEARHRKGDLTLEAYRKLLADYDSRREKAETTISGILLRIREEIR
ncbi:MAG: hypothetical protein QXN95_02395 [Candidatus Bathyarchaeia archaeon]